MILFGLYLASQHSDRPSILFLSLMITLFLIGMFWTHSNLAHFTISNVEIDSDFVGTKAALRISFRTERAQGPLFSLQLFNRLVDIPQDAIKTEFLKLPLTTRGLHSLREFKISTTYPFGLFYAWRYWEGNAPHYAYPSRRPLEDPFLPEAASAPAAGETQKNYPRAQASSGLAEDSLMHKEFLDGDPARRIDWKLYARSGLLRRKEFGEADSQPVILSLESAPGSSLEERLSYLSTALYWLHQHDCPFQLELKPGEVSTHYELSLQRLATFKST